VVSPLVGDLLPVMIVVFTPLSTIFQLNIVAIILLVEETGVPGVISITYYNIIIDSLYEYERIFFIYFTHDLNRYTLNKKYKNTNKETK
jgi:hypothetical protein